jgi:hypothetical protein
MAAMQPKLIVEQKITPLVNKYVVHQANPDGTKGPLLAFAQQKRLAFKEKVEFWADEQKSQLAFTMQAEKVMDIHGRFFVADPHGNRIGAFKKEFKQSLVVSTWSIVDENGDAKVRIAESNAALAILRRFGGEIPLVGIFVELVVMFLKYHFDLTDMHTNEKVGRYVKTKLFYDHYQLLMDDAAYEQQDPRVLAALAVALDALQSR